MDNIKINQLEIENVKRVKAVKIQPSRDGLTVIGGKNGQGKTSVLDSIAWALGGNSFRPSEAKREGSATDPYLKVILSNGLVVERRGKNSDLKVTDPNGGKSGQKLLDEFIEELALDLPKFLNANNKEKAETLLRIIGVGDKLRELEDKEKGIYNQRREIGRIADQKKKFADEQIYYPEAPHDIVSAAELIKQQQEILARNGERQRQKDEYESILAQIEAVESQLEELERKKRELYERKKDAERPPAELRMESTAELEAAIADVEETNRKVRANMDKDRADDDALQLKHQYEEAGVKLEEVRKQKKELLKSADLPLEGLSVEDGELVYNGQKWDNMSSSEQLVVGTAIVRKLNPKCSFVLLDKLEQMDTDTLAEFGAWLEGEGLQAIATRVSTGSECDIIISDGYSYDKDGKATVDAAPAKEEKAAKTWKKGEF